jgi:hypothetical protein
MKQFEVFNPYNRHDRFIGPILACRRVAVDWAKKEAAWKCGLFERPNWPIQIIGKGHMEEIDIRLYRVKGD